MTFAIGTRVRTKSRARGHTRLPGYLQHQHGVIVKCLGEFVFPDDYVRDGGIVKRTLYTVGFDALSVFGDTRNGTIYADLFDAYLEAGE